MSTVPRSTRLITDAARAVLRPLGMRQRGRSRIWIDDRAWWLIVAEFQPSGYQEGSYLNVGAMWLWYERNGLSFDEGHRLWWQDDGTFFTTPPLGAVGAHQFVRLVNGDQFAHDAAFLADLAAMRVRELRTQFATPTAIAHHLSTAPIAPQARGWPEYHAGVAAGLAGNTEAAKQWFTQLLARPLSFDWEVERADRARRLHALIDDHEAFVQQITDSVEDCRRSLKLAPVGAFDFGC